jgi:hypothetical protein
MITAYITAPATGSVAARTADQTFSVFGIRTSALS